MEVTMVSNNHGCESHNQMSVNRRRFVKAAGAAGIAGFAGCTGGQPSSESTGGATTGKSSNSEPTKLTYWTLFSGGDGAAMKTLVGKFNEEHDSIQIQRERQPYDEYYDKLFTSATSGDAPDLAVMHASQQRRFQDAIVPIEEHLDGGIDEKYVSSIWDRTKLDGKKYGLPLDTFVNGLYYNKDIFEEAGLDPEKPPTNFSELEEAANAITENTDKLAFNPEPYGRLYYRSFYAFLKSSGGDLLTDDRSAAAFDSDVGRLVSQFHADVPGKYGWDKPDSSDNRGIKGFRAGDVAMIINGTWFYGVVNSLDFEWGLTKPFVNPEATAKFTRAGSHQLVLPQQQKQSDAKFQAALEAAQWLTQQGEVWGTKAGHLPASQSVYDSGTLESAPVWDRTLSTFYEIAQDDQLLFEPSLQNNEDWKRPVTSAMEQVYSHQLDPEEAVTQAAEKVTANLQG